MVFDPGAGGSGNDGSFPTKPATYVPNDYNAYRDTPVPGLGNARTATASDLPRNLARMAPELRAPMQVGHSVTVSQALNRLLHQRDHSKIVALQEELIRAGLLNPHDGQGFVAGVVDSSDATYFAYARAMADAIEQDMPLAKLLRDRAHDPNNTLGQAYWQTYIGDQQAAANGGVQTQTQTNYDFTSGTDARAYAQSQYEDMLGRRVSDHEAAAFAHALNAYEQSHPSMTTTTTDANNNSTSSTTGGVSPSMFAQESIIQNHGEEYAKTQGQQLYDLFASIIGGE